MDPITQPDDNDLLQSFGYVPQPFRRISFASMLGMAFTILNTWSVLSAALPLSLGRGGPIVVTWGLLVAGVGNLCLAVSLGEFLSIYPSAGGQYHFVAMLAPIRYVRPLSWTTVWLCVFGWMSVAASGCLLTSQVALGLIDTPCGNLSACRTIQLTAYIAVTGTAFFLNFMLHNLVPLLSRAAFTWSMTGFAVMLIVAFAYGPDLAAANYVFGQFINNTGWPDWMAFMLGLLQAGLGLNGFDAVAHMIEEIPNPTAYGPVIMVMCVGLGTCSGFVFLTALLFLSGGSDTVERIIQSNSNPLVEILLVATASKTVAKCLAIFPLICLMLGTMSIFTTSSRMSFAFARDGGLPWSSKLAEVGNSHGLPQNALCLTTGVTLLFGVVFLISDATFNAIAAASVSSLSLSYSLPVLLHLLRGRKLARKATFRLPEPIAWAVNLVGITYCLCTSVLFLLPPLLPLNLAHSNYGSAAILLMFCACVLSWHMNGHRIFRGSSAMSSFQSLIPTEPEDGREQIDAESDNTAAED